MRGIERQWGERGCDSERGRGESALKMEREMGRESGRGRQTEGGIEGEWAVKRLRQREGDRVTEKEKREKDRQR